MMKKILLLPAISILLFCAPAFADFAKGFYAYNKGDYATAMKEWKPLSEQGDVSAQSNLGLMYNSGRGVIQDYKSAFKWFRLAAEQRDAGAHIWWNIMALHGVVSAQFSLGNMYRKGQGVIQDYTRAHMWWNIAASQGYKMGVKNRDLMAKEMTPSQIEKAQTLARECVAKNYKDC
jgi:TPR repeat protein